MTELIENIWKLVEDECVQYSAIDPNFIFHKNKMGEFKGLFMGNYQTIKDEYMDSTVKYLDRHKVAAIITISLIQANVIKYKNLDDNTLVFIGAEIVSLKVALAYMLTELNAKLKEVGENKHIKEFVLPNAQSCKTDYISILCRNLYYAKEANHLRILELSEKLFLLEYILLLKNDINPDILREE